MPQAFLEYTAVAITLSEISPILKVMYFLPLLPAILVQNTMMTDFHSSRNQFQDFSPQS